MNTFNVGDKVVLNGTTEPVMIIKGHPTYINLLLLHQRDVKHL